MTLILNTKEITEVRRLEKCLASGLVPVMDVQNFLSGIRQKIDRCEKIETMIYYDDDVIFPAGSEKKRQNLKEDRKSSLT